MEFLPFVPYADTIQDIWQTAFKSWQFNLISLLNMDDSNFISTTRASPSLTTFIHRLWDTHIEGESVDSQLLKYVFLIYVRLSQSSDTRNHRLFETDLLIKLAVVYSGTNTPQLREIMQPFEEQLAPIVHTLIESIEPLAHMSINLEVLKRAHIVARTFDALVSTLVPGFIAVDVLVTEWYRSLVPCLKKAVDQDSHLAPYAYMIKASLVSAFAVSAELRFFRPFGYMLNDAHELVKISEPTNRDEAVNWMSRWIEQNEIRPSSPFVDAPLIMDWESAYKISDKIRQINKDLFSGNDDMLEILQLQMEQVRDTMNETHSWQPDVDDREQKVLQIREVFSDLSDDVIEHYLESNHGDAEAVIMHLLNEKEAPSVLSSRKNIYDNDEFDVFANKTVDTSKMYLGKKDKGNADALLEDKSVIDKTSIMQRVIDMYEDEYDDTYDDINDAAGVVTMGQEEAQDVVKRKVVVQDPGAEHEQLLVHVYMDNPDVLKRNGTARKSPKRAELRKQTGMTDEQLEGWAIMFNRNPRKQRILDKYMLFENKNDQTPVKQESSKQSHSKEPTGQSAQKAPQKNESKDRAYREKNKARFGNHNRKAMRSKKISKAGPPPS
ncbi:hypothetical protein BCV72DRAFT_118389 [Rhizopus microsporus var. microsporus]|uniref:CUE domain-containing protein n=2 Tax=Rhizopus microsporus TaxID=58291 RepID=A0A2G4SPA2_RHIZD|nr:uncharacterized protein RHIMIDRAFT_239440 [Rhizopus microsporus ATCC 52813]ORE06779.1 hypothetical protein BCV72DRAFT_118389 [Rhizopus microsporus var. microsporus]PHZ10618.1 hypothetical protein RHIMIDRAFT_239440 [Rhizopus microsporus ATCC 52813]